MSIRTAELEDAEVAHQMKWMKFSFTVSTDFWFTGLAFLGTGLVGLVVSRRKNKLG